MKTLLSLVGLSFLVAVLEVQEGWCDGRVMVQFIFFGNEKGVDREGNCCDKHLLRCVKDGCDHMFNICVDRVGGYGCTFGRLQSQAIYDKDSIEFNDDIGGLSNPLAFPFKGAGPAKVDIKVAVYDEDKGFDQKDTFVDLVKITVNKLTTEKVLHRGSHRTALDTKVWIECDEGWGGDNCSVKNTKMRDLWRRFEDYNLV